jgi:pyruvate,water dikinase
VPLAVRSSAVDEDGASASFAGQHLTLLNVSSADQVTSAVMEVWSGPTVTVRVAMGGES